MAPASDSPSSPASLAAGSLVSAFAQCYAWHQAATAPFRTLGFGIDTCRRDGKLQPVSEHTVAATPFCRLVAFRAATPGPARRLLCAPLAGHRALQLRGMIETLLEDGDVYVTDWIDARDIPVSAGPFSFDRNVLTLAGFMTMLGTAGLDVIAVCQAAVPALGACARLAAQGMAEPATLALIAGPIDARIHPTRIDRMAAAMTPAAFRRRWTGPVPAGYAGAGRMVYPGFLQAAALSGEAAGHHVVLASELATALWCRPAHAPGALHAVAVHYGAMLDLPAEFVADTLRVVFRAFQLPRGRWKVAGEAVRPRVLRTMRLLTVEGGRDSVTGAGQTHAAHALCTGLPAAHHASLTFPDCAHYDLLGGERWRVQVWPAIQAWLARAQPAPQGGTARTAPRAAQDSSTYVPGASTSAPGAGSRAGTRPLSRAASHSNQHGHHEPS
ncbi:Polyhydroxyalkanoate depolymerase [Cupriavidus sp. H19C3]